MTPHRLGLSVSPEPAAGVIAAVMAIVAGFWNVHTVLLFSLVVLAGGIDLLAGSRRASARERLNLGEEFDRQTLDDGARAKAFYLLVSLFLGMGADSLDAVTGGRLDLGIAGPFADLTPVTSAALFWRFIREVASIFRNIDQTPGGKNAIFPGFVRLVDTFRWRAAPHTSGPLPERRWGDDISPEERAWIEMELGIRRRGEERP